MRRTCAKLHLCANALCDNVQFTETSQELDEDMRRTCTKLHLCADALCDNIQYRRGNVRRSSVPAEIQANKGTRPRDSQGPEFRGFQAPKHVCRKPGLFAHENWSMFIDRIQLASRNLSPILDISITRIISMPYYSSSTF